MIVFDSYPYPPGFLWDTSEIMLGIQKSIMSFYFSNPQGVRSFGPYFPVCPFIIAIIFLYIIFIIHFVEEEISFYANKYV